MGWIPETYTVESVTIGHPDKVCDQISDAILDAYLEQDPNARVAVEVLGSHGTLTIGGEITSSADVDIEAVARKTYRDIGYEDSFKTFVTIAKQSQDIAKGVDTGGAGDQGIMYGFATNETKEMLPKGFMLARRLTERLEQLREEAPGFTWLKPDGKSQVTIKEGSVTTVLVSTQHEESHPHEKIIETLTRDCIRPVVDKVAEYEILINPTGNFSIGGFTADAGMTGRKIMVDTYGGLVPHGGGCFSGKDPTKVDRSGAYMARFAAKALVSQGRGREVLVSVAYAIGKAEPLMVTAMNENGEDLSDALGSFDFRPQAIIDRLDLRRPIYLETAKRGHFGNSSFPWEQTM